MDIPYKSQSSLLSTLFLFSKEKHVSFGELRDQELHSYWHMVTVKEEWSGSL